jgi:hypothetical protein
MMTSFWKAALASLFGYVLIVITGIWIGLWFILAAVPVLQISWSLFCVIRLVQLWRCGAPRKTAVESDRESFGFALGGLLSSCVLCFLLIVWSQVV